MCGADFCTKAQKGASSGSSPRVRSRHGSAAAGYRVAGIISACAEQTRRSGSAACAARDHLRVCGADPGLYHLGYGKPGSSPRVRSRRFLSPLCHLMAGIISACAEQTFCSVNVPTAFGDHLRVCGADPAGQRRQTRHRGSSPRVRSRLAVLAFFVFAMGIISACAEQTSSRRAVGNHHRDHLRVCGADVLVPFVQLLFEGSSPRVRSRPGEGHFVAVQDGIISACAEQTEWLSPRRARARDHLRVCGADTRGVGTATDPSGSSPRVRSRLVGVLERNPHQRIISACAEQTTVA